MIVVQPTLGELVDGTLMRLEGAQGTAATTVITDSLTAVATDNTLTLADSDAANVSDVLEIGNELMLVTAKSADATPVFTVSRAYYFSELGTATANVDVVTVNPRYPRVRIAQAIKRSFGRLEALGLPMTETDTYQRVTDMKYIELPAYTRDVLRVGYLTDDMRWHELDGWEFIDDVPTAKVTTGKMLRLSRLVMNDDDIEVTIRRPYRWGGTQPASTNVILESDYVTMVEGTEDMPIHYAVAWLMGSREINRTEVDRAEEWNQGEPTRGGGSASLVRLAWQDFYRHLDEARRLVPTLPLHRPYRKMVRIR